MYISLLVEVRATRCIDRLDPYRCLHVLATDIRFTRLHLARLLLQQLLESQRVRHHMQAFEVVSGDLRLHEGIT